MKIQLIRSILKEKIGYAYGAFCAVFMLNLTDLSWSNLKAVAQQGYSAPLMASALTTDPKNTFTLTPFVTVLGGIALSVTLISFASLSPLTLALSLSYIIGAFCAGLQVPYATRENFSKALALKVVATSKNEQYGKTLLSILRKHSNTDKEAILDEIAYVKTDSNITDEILARLIESYSKNSLSLPFGYLSHSLATLKHVISNDAKFVEAVTNIVNCEDCTTLRFAAVVTRVQRIARKIQIGLEFAKNAEKPAGLVSAALYCLIPAKASIFFKNYQEGGLKKALRSRKI